MRASAALLIPESLLATTGCMSIRQRTKGRGSPRILPGFTHDFARLRDGSGQDRPADGLRCLLDLPLSLAVDLVMLPVDIGWRHGDPPATPRPRPDPPPAPAPR